MKRILFNSRNLAACFDYNPIRNSNSIAIAHRSRRGNDLLSQSHALTTVSHCCYSGRNGGAGEPYHSVSSSQRMQLKNCKLISSPFFKKWKCILGLWSSLIDFRKIILWILFWLIGYDICWINAGNSRGNFVQCTCVNHESPSLPPSRLFAPPPAL